MRIQTLFLLFLFGISVVGSAVEMEGVKVPETRVVSGKTLTLNGAGLRTATVFKVRLYVAAFYTPEKITSVEQVYASNGPFRFDFTFLRPFGKEKVDEAWLWQFKESGVMTYEGRDAQVKAFSDAFGPIKKFGVETVEIEGDETRIYDDGVFRAAVKGREFQKAFLELWFGSKPVMPTLKDAFLGKKAS